MHNNVYVTANWWTSLRMGNVYSIHASYVYTVYILKHAKARTSIFFWQNIDVWENDRHAVANPFKLNCVCVRVHVRAFIFFSPYPCKYHNNGVWSDGLRFLIPSYNARTTILYIRVVCIIILYPGVKIHCSEIKCLFMFYLFMLRIEIPYSFSLIHICRKFYYSSIRLFDRSSLMMIRMFILFCIEMRLIQYYLRM